MNQDIFWIGIDVAKKTFDAALVRPGQRFPQTQLREVPAETFRRDPDGVQRFVHWMGEQVAQEPDPPQARVVMEATGTYSVELTAWLCEACPMLAPAIENPERTNAFMNSMALRNRTDRLEARALAFYGAERRPAPYEPLTPEHRKLRELSRFRDSLIAEKTAETNRQEQWVESKLVRRLQAQRQRQLKAAIDKVEAEMKKLIAQTPHLKRDFALLVTIPGVAFVTAAVILAEMGDLRRFARSRQVTAFAGVSPRQVVSGTSINGRPRLCKKGNPRVRQALYMSALTAVKPKTQLRETYERLLANGKPPMVALGAIMRKLLCVMRAILINETPFKKQWKKCPA